MGKHVVVGMGQVGKALSAVLKLAHCVQDIRFTPAYASDYVLRLSTDVLHICFPYSEMFADNVLDYQEAFIPKHTVIHSTVPIGTSRKCNAIHSPVVGQHADLETSLLTFIKFIGGTNASDVADYFRATGMRVYLFDNQETTELMKLASTTFYGLCIKYTHHMKQQCIKHNIPFEAWTLWTKSYNEGYARLGHSEYLRPELVPIMAEIGGHCVLPNCDLFDSAFARFIKELEC